MFQYFCHYTLRYGLLICASEIAHGKLLRQEDANYFKVLRPCVSPDPHAPRLFLAHSPSQWDVAALVELVARPVSRACETAVKEPQVDFRA